MNTALDQNQTELGVAVLSVALQVLSDGDGLLDEEVHILRHREGASPDALLQIHYTYRSSSEF